MKKFRVFMFVLIATVILGGAVMVGGAYMIACTSGDDTGNCKGIDEACSNTNQCCAGLTCRYMGSGPGGGWQCQDY